jgi:hypothetical protein
MRNIHRHVRFLKHHFGPLFLLIIGLLVSYLPTLQNSFVDWDDVQNFVQNPWIASPSWASFRWSLTATHLGVFQPLSWLFIQIQSWIFGVRPDVFHGVSLCLHLAIALILYFLCLDIERLTVPQPSLADHRDRWIVATAVLLVMLHPLRVEVVAWSSCQPYLLAIFFAVIGFRAYIRSNTDHLEDAQKTSRSALLFFSLSCLSKTLILALPMILLILDYYPLRRFHKTSLKTPCSA